MYFNKFTRLEWFTPGLKLWSNRIPLRFDTYSSACENFCRYCVLKGTEIITEHGLKSIENLSNGDKVLSRNINTNKDVLSTITDVMNRNVSEIYKLETKNRTLFITGEHPILTKRGWVDVKDLLDGDEIWESE